MKKLLYLLITICLVTSCNKSNFLKESPSGTFVESNFYGQGGASEAQAAVDAIYNGLYSIYDRSMLLLNDLPTDDEKNGIGMGNQFLQDLEYLKYSSQNSIIQGMWADNYSAIGRANNAIKNIGVMSIDTALKSRLIGEASFLRALFYFNLVRYYGDVPLILSLKTVQDAYIPRVPKEQVYAQIIKDLQFAEDNLPISYNNKNIGRATSGAAIILLGKVYLTRHDFQKSADELAKVVENEGKYGYSLFNDFGDNWKLATENGKEMVFSVQYSSPPGHTNIKMRAAAARYSVSGGNVPGIIGAFESDIPTMDLYSNYIDQDTRKNVTFKLEYLSPKNGKIYKSSIPLFGKFWQEGLASTPDCSINTPVFRYADALLMYAEALNEIDKTSKATDILNRIRERAFHDTQHNYFGLTQSEFRDKVYFERRLEFAFEGMRWFDLVRTNRLLDIMKAHGTLEAQMAGTSIKSSITTNAKEYQSLYPIPQVEIDLNKLLTQNPGY
ncbi:MAG: RagB/SusD family nutrient uptake outer membrane protein [Ginsengibacter sp.]